MLNMPTLYNILGNELTELHVHMDITGLQLLTSASTV